MDTKKDLQKIFQNTLTTFWDKSLEPVLNKILGRLDGVESQLNGVTGRLGKVEGRLGKVEGRLGKVEGRLGKVEGRLNKVEEKVISVDQRTRSMDAQLETIEKTLAQKADTELVNRVEESILTKINGKFDDHEKRITRLEQPSAFP